MKTMSDIKKKQNDETKTLTISPHRMATAA